MNLTLNVLGGFSLQDSNGSAIPVSRTKARALLCYLASNDQQRQSRQRLCDLLWTRSDPQLASNSLRQIVSRLRKALPGAEYYFEIDRDSMAFNRQNWNVDIWQLQAAHQSTSLVEKQAAFDLYRGDLFAGFDVAEDAFDEWLMLERRKTEQRAIDLGNTLLAAYRDRQDFHALTRHAMQMIELEPYCEALYRQAMYGLVSLGRHGEALEIYENLCLRLRDDLGENPDPELVRFAEDLRRERTPASSAFRETAQPAREDRRRSAVDHLHSAARLLSGQGVHVMAASTYDNAFALNESLDRPNGRSVGLLLGLYRERFMLGDFDAACRTASLALDRAGSDNNSAANIVRAELAVANCERMAGRLTKALLHGRNALVATCHVKTEEHAELRVRANLSVGTSHFMLGNYSAAFPLLHDNVALLSEVDLNLDDEAEPGLPLLRTFGWTIWCCSEMGKFELGHQIAEKALRLAVEQGDLYSLNNCRIALGVLLLHKGEFEAANEILRQADRSVKSAKIDGLAPMVRMPLAMCLAETGHLQEAQETVLSVKAWPDLPIIKAGLSMIAVHRGAGKSAEVMAHEGLALAKRIGARGDEGWCWLSLAGAQRSLGNHRDADKALEQAAAISTRLGMVPLGAFCSNLAQDH